MRDRPFYGYGRWLNNVEREVKIADANNIGEAIQELTKLLGSVPVRVVEKYNSHGWHYERFYDSSGFLYKKTRWKPHNEVEVKFLRKGDVERAGLSVGVYYPRTMTSAIYV